MNCIASEFVLFFSRAGGLVFEYGGVRKFACSVCCVSRAAHGHSLQLDQNQAPAVFISGLLFHFFLRITFLPVLSDGSETKNPQSRAQKNLLCD